MVCKLDSETVPLECPPRPIQFYSILSRYDAALCMTRHFFEEVELQHEQRGRLREIFETKRDVTPAVVEQLAGEFDTVDGFLAALEGLP